MPLGAAVASKLRLREICFRSNRNDGSCCTVPMTPGRKVLTSDTLRRLTQSGDKGARRETRACHGQTSCSLARRHSVYANCTVRLDCATVLIEGGFGFGWNRKCCDACIIIRSFHLGSSTFQNPSSECVITKAKFRSNWSGQSVLGSTVL